MYETVFFFLQSLIQFANNIIYKFITYIGMHLIPDLRFIPLPYYYFYVVLSVYYVRPSDVICAVDIILLCFNAYYNMDVLIKVV